MHHEPKTARPVDRFAIDGKFAAPDEHVPLLVIGGGIAGLAAATHAAQLGIKVVLIDENPVSANLMGLDVPLFYGQRMTAAVQEPARMVERLIVSSPAISAAFDAGVDIRLGQTAWGVFANGAASNGLPARVAGLCDGTRSWMCGFDALILATGARDLVLGFAGVDLPGVVGACGLQSLLTRYDAFDGHRLVIVGSGDLAAETAHAALDRGIAVTGMLEIMQEPQISPDMVAGLRARGVSIDIGVTGLRAESNAVGVAAAVITQSGKDGHKRLPCDTLCLAIGAVPAIELAGALGCALSFRGDLGGYVPLTSAHGETSVPGIYCVGDCAGLSLPADCEAHGSTAAIAALAFLTGGNPPPTPVKRASRPDTTAYRMAWVRASHESSDGQTLVCLCEEVTRAELLGIRPPRYLGCASDHLAARNSKTLSSDGPLNPDQIKRLTRAGMGTCQGRRCREQIAMLLALDSGVALSDVPLASYRAPVRPLPLGVLADTAPQPDWDVWFGIPTQWIPYAMIGTAEETALLESGGGGNMHA